MNKDQKQYSCIITGQPHKVTHQSGLKTNYMRGYQYKTKNLKAVECDYDYHFNKFSEELVKEGVTLPIESPVIIDYLFKFEISKVTDYRRTQKPDCDNLVKTIQDRLMKCGILKDDSIVYKISCEKQNCKKGEGTTKLTITI